MDTEGEKIEVDIVDDTAAKPADIVIVDKADDKPVEQDDVTAQLAKLKGQLAGEQRARQQAEDRANTLAQSEHRSKTEAQDANIHLIANAIAVVEGQNDSLKSQFKQAIVDGDADAMADIQMVMASNAAKLSKLEDGKAALESAPKVEAPRLVVSDQVEALASQLTPRSASWVRAHPEYATEPNKYQKMLAAHNLAIADGIAPDSDAYFDSVEATLRINRAAPVQQSDDAMSDAAQVTQRRSAPPAAPVSRSGSTPGSKPNRVTLSADEREMASMMGMSEQDYAKNKLALVKEGRLH